MTKVVDKSIVKEALRELIQEEPEVFRALIKKVLAEESQLDNSEFDQFTQRNFARFDATFRALA